MKEWMWCNIASMLLGSIPISIACYVTKSAVPLLAFLLVPRCSMHERVSDKEDNQNE